MTTKKEAVAAKRRDELDQVIAELRTVLRRETDDVILAGDLLIKCRKLLGPSSHGKWQDWLEENFSLSYRTALRYVTAAEYAKRQKCHVSLLSNLSAGVLYRLAEGKYTKEAEAAILAQAKASKRIDQTQAEAISKKLEAPPAKPPPAESPPNDADDDAEAEAILGGPPPAVTPPEPAPPPNVAMLDFNKAIDTLKRLMTKPLAHFAVSTAHSVADLEAVEAFIRDVVLARQPVGQSNEKDKI